MQLMQEYVQKSMSTTLPLSSARVRGSELIQAPPPMSSGAVFWKGFKDWGEDFNFSSSFLTC